MIRKEDALQFDDVISIHCYETKEIDTKIGNAWDVCKILHSNEQLEEFKGVLGVKVDNDQISRMVSDDDLLYVRFRNPTQITMFKDVD